MNRAADAGAEYRLFGREAENKALASALAAARNGRGSLVLVGGEAGIGKTALIDSLVNSAQADEWLVLTGSCYDLSMTPPFGPWNDVMRASASAAAEQNMAQVPPLESVRAMDRFAASRELLLGLAATRPLLIILEDIHWADDASLDVVRRIGREIDGLPVLLVVTYRDDEVTRRHPPYQLLPLLLR